MPNHLFFDLDHTLWDFDRNAEDTLRELYSEYQLERYCEATCDQFIDRYIENNDRLWDLYRNHKVNKEELRVLRFENTFRDIGMAEEHIPSDFGDRYLAVCPTKTHLVPGAIELLEHLVQDYELHLITNGFAESQRTKLKYSGLQAYFKSLTISEEVGTNKPHPAIFSHALQKAGSRKSTGIYVGDNAIADVQGGLNAGWKVIWYNPSNAEVDMEYLANPRLSIVSHLLEVIGRL